MQALRADVPDAVANLVHRAMAKADADRFQSAAQFAVAVEQVAESVYPGAGVIDTTARYLTA